MPIVCIVTVWKLSARLRGMVMSPLGQFPRRVNAAACTSDKGMVEARFGPGRKCCIDLQLA